MYHRRPLPLRPIELFQPVEGASDGRLADVQILRQPTDGLELVGLVDHERYGELPERDRVGPS